MKPATPLLAHNAAKSSISREQRCHRFHPTTKTGPQRCQRFQPGIVLHRRGKQCTRAYTVARATRQCAYPRSAMPLRNAIRKVRPRPIIPHAIPTPRQRRIRRIPTIKLQTMKHIRGNCMRNCRRVGAWPGFETTRRAKLAARTASGRAAAHRHTQRPGPPAPGTPAAPQETQYRGAGPQARAPSATTQT